MTVMANIVVKKNDGTTDITWSAMTPSAGNNVPAIWRSQSVGGSAGFRPEFRLTSKDGGDGKTRVLRGTISYPQLATDTTTSLVQVPNRASADINWRLPAEMPATDINEFASQFANLIASVLIKDSVKEGFAPN